MAGSNVQYAGSHPTKRKKVYYNGSTALVKNQPLCYVEDADTLATVQAAEASTPGSQNFGLVRGVLVETPTTASIPFFAGILADGEEGKSGGVWVEIDVCHRDDLVNVRVEGTTDIAVGDHLAQVNAQAYLTHQAFDAEASKFYALEAFTADSEGVILAKRL